MNLHLYCRVKSICSVHGWGPWDYIVDCEDLAFHLSELYKRPLLNCRLERPFSCAPCLIVPLISPL